MRKRFFTVVVLLVIFSLAFLLLKENEGRTAAEQKLKDLQFKVDSLGSEKENVINELETRVSEMEGQLKESEARYQTLSEEKNAEITGLMTEAQERSEQHEAAISAKAQEITGLESRVQEESAKFNALLGEKNAEINDLGKRLEDASAKISTLLRKIEGLETKNLSGENKIAELEAELQRLGQQKARLSEIIREDETRQAPND